MAFFTIFQEARAKGLQCTTEQERSPLGIASILENRLALTSKKRRNFICSLSYDSIKILDEPSATKDYKSYPDIKNSKDEATEINLCEILFKAIAIFFF